MKYLLLFMLLVFTTLGNAQDRKKITKEMLEEESCPLDETAEAAYLDQNLRVFYLFDNHRGWQQRLEYYYLVKVYERDGEKYGTFSVPYYNLEGEKESVKDVKATAYNLEGGRITESKLGKKELFHQEVNKELTRLKFSVPNVKKGSVVEVRYTITSPFLYSIPKWYFQHPIPTLKSTMVLEKPSYFGFTPIPSGYLPLEIKEAEKSSGGFQTQTYKIVTNDIPALEADDYVLDIDDYRLGIKYEIYSVEFPGQHIEYHSKDWNFIADKILTSAYFGAELNKNHKQLASIINAAKLLATPSEKTEYLYKYVQDNYVWNNKIRLYCGEKNGLSKLSQTKIGNSAELNLLLLYLLQESGVDAKPLATKRRKTGLLNTKYPTLTELNNMLVLVTHESEKIVVDASAKWCPLGMLPTRSINYQGVVCYKDKGEVINMMNTSVYRNSVMAQYKVNMTNNTLDGTVKERKNDSAAQIYRSEIAQGIRAENEDEAGNVTLVTQTQNLTDIEQPLLLEKEKKLVTYHRTIGDNIFIDGTLDFGLKENPFKAESRDYSIFYDYALDLKYIIEIEIPEGYEVEALPDVSKVALSDKSFTFSYQAKLQGEKLYIYYLLKRTASIFPANTYQEVKQMYDKIVVKSKDKIVLKKK